MAVTFEKIQKRFDYMFSAWQHDRKEGRIDMRYAAGDPWDERERQLRQQYERPCMSFDEAGQYTNRIINSLRRSKRGIVVAPRTLDPNVERSASLKEDKIRQIQYESKAQRAFSTAAENAIQRGFGFVMVGMRWVEEKNPTKRSFGRELYIKRIANPETVLIDPDFREADASDMRDAVVIDTMSVDEFKATWPGAKVCNFEPTGQAYAGDAGAEDMEDSEVVQIGAYWYVELVRDKLYLFSLPTGEEMTATAHDLRKAGMVVNEEKGEIYAKEGNVEVVWQIQGQRPYHRKRVCQYVCNGEKILEENEWPGTTIPIAPMFGKEFWLNEKAGTKRRYHSLLRTARDPMKLLCYARSTAAELVGQTPRAPWIGYKGQFAGSVDDWNNANRVPIGMLEANAFTPEYPEGMGNGPLPLPTRAQFEPAIQAVEMLAESARRGVQAAMGMDTLPTAAQRQNEKSGIALQRITEQQDLGTYHFVDNYEGLITRVGQILNETIEAVYGDAEMTSVTTAEEKQRIVVLNQPVQDEKTGKEVVNTLVGDHDVIVKTGPDYNSEREEATEVATQLASPEMLAAAVQGNPKASKIVSLALKLRNGGPIVESIAEIFDPGENEGAQLRAQMEQAQLQIQQMQEALVGLNQHARALENELQNAKAGNETKLLIAERKNQTDLAIAAMNADIKQAELRVEQLTRAMDTEIRQAEHRLAEHNQAMQAQAQQSKALEVA